MRSAGNVRVAVALLSSALLSSGGERASLPPPSPPGWRLVWRDEFDGPRLDTTNWARAIGGDGWGHAELAFCTDRRENMRVEAGQLIVEARRGKPGGDAYTSAVLTPR